MDGISVAASIAGLVSLADTVFTRTYRYAKSVKHAAKEINELAIAVRDLSSLLHGLNLVLLELEDQAGGQDLSNLAEFRLHHVSSCLTTLTKIQQKLDKHQPEVGEHQPIKQALKNLKWPFSMSDTKGLLAEVEKHKAAINVALSGDTLATVLRTLSRQDDLANEIKDLKDRQSERWAMDDHIRMDKYRRKVLTFFGKNDPGSNHALNLKLRHPLTGLWVTESLIFREWLLTQNSKLWLSGIPGAGKTVIAASIIEEAMKESSEDRAVAYFYCDYQDTEKQTPFNVLGSLASQLARQNEDAFSMLDELYCACHPTDKPSTSPDPRVLSAKIREMTSCFDDVSIIVDGLDECGIHTSNVVELLVELASDKTSNARALFLSRDDGEIREHLSGDYKHMEIAAQSEDLRLYVAAEMEARQQKHGRERLRIRSTSLKEHMMKTLVERADGMFRWVACQLDYICSLPNDAEKRKALASLPPGLNATYERILERVNQNDESIQRMVQNTLQWIVSPIEVIPATALCHAISIMDGDKTIDQEAFYDEEDILMHCSSLIRRSADGETLELAHFTVKEFLFTLDPDTCSPYSRYSQVESFVFPHLAITCLTYITLDCCRGTLIDDLDTWEEHQFNQYPLRRHAVKYWMDYAQNNWENPRILALAKFLFDPAGTACFLSWARDFVYYQNSHQLPDEIHFDTCTRYFSAGGLKPLHMTSALGLVGICRWLIDSGCSVDERSNVGTPLHCTLLGPYWLSESLSSSEWFSYLAPFQHDVGIQSRMQALKMLLDNGADCNVSYRDLFGNEFSCSYLALYSDIGRESEHPLVKVVAAGARVEKELLDDLDDVLEEVLVENKFIEALMCALKETNQDHSIRLKAAIKLNSSTGLDLINSHSVELSHKGIEDLIDLFRSAVRFDQTQVMEELIKDKRLDVLHKDEISGSTFLHEAARRNSIGAIRLLLSLGVDVNSTDEDNNTPLHLALYGDPSERYEQCISLLLDHGANVNAVDSDGRTAWHDAATMTAAIPLLLARCGDDTQGLAIADKDGLIPVIVAAQESQTATCQLLVSHSSYAHRFCPDGLSLVHYAVKLNSITLLKLLQSTGIDLSEKTQDGRTGLHFISNRITLDIANLLIHSGIDPNSKAANGETPLHILVRLWPSLDVDLCDSLLDIFATKKSINSCTTEGLTPLHYAFDLSHGLNSSSLRFTDTLRAKFLIEKGADVHHRLEDGTCYLVYLISQYIRLRRPILERNSILSPRKVEDDERLVWAWSMTQLFCKLVIEHTTDVALLEELIEIAGNDGPRVRMLNWCLATPDASELVDLLLDRGVDVDLCNYGTTENRAWSAINVVCISKTPVETFRRVLEKSKRRLMEPDMSGLNLVHLACVKESTSSPEILEELLKYGLHPNLRAGNRLAQTPLMIAAKSGKQDHFQKLIDHGADIRLKDSEDWEAAHYAAEGGSTTIIEHLIDYDIDWNSCITIQGLNILHVAIIHNHYGFVSFVAKRSLIDALGYQGANEVSALGYAANFGRLTSLQILLDTQNISVDAIVAKSGVRMINLAVSNGHLDVVQELLRRKCNLFPTTSGMTPQLQALELGRQDIFKVLEEYEAKNGTRLGTPVNPDALSSMDQPYVAEFGACSSKTLGELQYAIKAGNLKICKGLVQAGLSIHNTFKCGCTPLLYALMMDRAEIAQFLLELGCSADGMICAESHKPGWTAIHLASRRSEDVDVLRLLLDKHRSTALLAFQKSINPVHIAVAFRNPKALEILLHYWWAWCGGDAEPRNSPNIPTESREIQSKKDHNNPKLDSVKLSSVYNAILKALDAKDLLSSTGPAFPGGTPLHLAVFIDNLELINILVRRGVKIDAINGLGDTALSLACKRGLVSVARTLLDNGANPSSRDFSGGTPAMGGAARNHIPILDLLPKHNFEMTDSYGWTVMHYATRGGPQVFSYLLRQGYCPYTESHRHNIPAVMALWKHQEVPEFLTLILNLDLDFKKLKGVLSQSFQTWGACCKDMVRLFLKRAPSDIIREELAATTWRNGSILGDAAVDGQEAIVKLFIQAGSNLELDQGEYGTPLLAACSCSRLPVVKTLVRAGAKISSTKAGKPFSAVDAAEAFPEIVHWLLVERYIEQPRLEFSTDSRKDVEVQPWSGVRFVAVETAGICVPDGKESSIERAKRLSELKRDLKGKVVYPINIVT